MKQRLKQIQDAYRQGIFPGAIYELEKKLLPVLKKMETRGIKLDIAFLKKLSKKISHRLQELEKEIYKLADTKFNINSSQQLSQILFKKLKISTQGLKKTPGGVISTAASELQKLKSKHNIIELILKYRELMKLKTTYIDPLPDQVDNQQRIHTNYHQLGTSTGRISSSDPNLQNIPVRGEWGKEIRKCFIAKKGNQLLSADYSQIELRIAAYLAEDRKMINAFERGEDIHKITAAEVNNVSINKVTPKMRYEAKALNFGILYGMSAIGFAEAAGITYQQAKKFIEEYMNNFSGVYNYIQQTKKQAQKRGYVKTILDRKRYLPEINSSNYYLRQSSERMAINMPIQGTSAEIIKVAMVELDKKLPASAKMLLQVHDELVFEIEQDKLEKATKIIKQTMENILKHPIFKQVKVISNIPLVVDINIGDNWGEMQPYAGITRSGDN